MEHSEATDTMASARYLLGELSEEERNAFEEHFFGCSECARDVRDGSTMIDSIRAEGRVARGGLKPAATFGWILSAAAIAAAAFLGLQNAQLRSDAEPRVLPSYSMLTMGSRGAANTTISDPSKPFALYIDIPPQPSHSNYRIEIRDAGNHTRLSLPVTADEARDTITVYVPPRRLQAGKYSVVIVGADSSTISSAPLEVR